MDYLENPFTPTFGEAPLHLAGRRGLLGNLNRAYGRLARDPFLTTLVSGARGTGKTSLLTVAAEHAEKLGWVSANVSAVPGMLEDILERAQEGAAHLVAVDDREPKITGLSVGQLFGVELEYQTSPQGNWRSRMNRLFSALEATQTGLLITVDEVRPELDEMIHLAATYQHFVREKKHVALLMAGLPHNVSQLLQDKSVSFLRRAKQTTLGRISDSDIETALHKTVQSGGRSMNEDAVARALEAIDGFPFMMQLVGYHAWEQAIGQSITEHDVLRGTALATADMKQEVLAASWRGLSGKDREFLTAMLPDKNESTIETIAARLGVNRSYAAQYKYRLLEQGLIEEPETSVVTFALPVLREYVAERQEKN